MIRRIGAMTFALALVFAVSAWAQGPTFEGTVSRVDSASRTIVFTDGRSLVVDPGTEVVMNGQPVALDAIRPGMVIHVQSRAATSTMPVTSAAAAPAGTSTIVPGQPVINASGTIASVDPASHTITFVDGRTVQVTDQSGVWQPAGLDQLRPGEHVFVHNAQPLAFRTPAAGEYRMGTVSRVDTATHSIVLQDGTVIQVTPSTAFDLGRQTVTIASLHPGDEVVIHVPQGSTFGASNDYTGSALPGSVASGRSAALSADQVMIMRTPQAP